MKKKSIVPSSTPESDIKTENEAPESEMLVDNSSDNIKTESDDQEIIAAQESETIHQPPTPQSSYITPKKKYSSQYALARVLIEQRRVVNVPQNGLWLIAGDKPSRNYVVQQGTQKVVCVQPQIHATT